MIDDGTMRLYLAWMVGAAIITGAILWLDPRPARSETAQPAIQSITIELKRDRRRFPKFMKFKQRKESGHAWTSKTER